MNDAIEIKKAPNQELADFRQAYVSGILTGRINPEDKSQITLDPQGKICYMELIYMFQKAMVKGLGKKSIINQQNLPDFVIRHYQQDPAWQ